MSAVTTFAQNFWTKSRNSTKGWQSIPMLYQLNTPEKAYTFEASSFTAACVVTTLLGGGFYSLWQAGKQVMPAFVFGGAEKWYQRTFGKNFQDVVQEVSPDEIAQIYLTLLMGKPEERQRYLHELSIIHHSKPALVSTTSQWRPQIKPTAYGSTFIPDSGATVQLLDGRALPVQEILGEIGTNLWLVDLGEIPSYAITPGGDGRWEEVETAAA
jgi:hypothetical protein